MASVSRVKAGPGQRGAGEIVGFVTEPGRLRLPRLKDRACISLTAVFWVGGRRRGREKMMENDRGHAWHGGVAPLSNSTGDPPYRPATYPPPVRIHSVDA